MGNRQALTSQQSEQLISYLKNTPLLEDFSLSIHSSALGKVNRHLCGTKGIPHLCSKICLPSVREAVDEALTSRKSVFFRCPLGLMSFAIPISSDSSLVCGGVRESLFDLYFYGSEQFEDLKHRENIEPFELLEQLEKLPVSTEEGVRETMLKAEGLIAAFASGEGRPQAADAGSQLQSAFGDIAAAIRSAESFDRATALFSETLAILFDVPAISLVRRDEENACWLIKTCWGAFSGPSSVTGQTLPFQENNYVPAILTGDEVRALFPGADAARAVCLPLADRTELFGMIVLFDTSFNGQDLAIAELLAGKLVEKLKETIMDPETQRQQRVARLLEMIRTLVLTESQDDLLRLIMEMSAELVGATNGSLMIVDKKNKVLRVASALGMHHLVARSLSASMGEGIAGRVALSGAPLLIRDIEQEPQVGRRNRNRFATKSCISLPLHFKGKTIGVLNLADKKNNAPFSTTDLDILTSFTEQATIILERAATLKKARLNTITDPLTSLYNMRFIKKRLKEEVSRSLRHNLHVTLMIVMPAAFPPYLETHGRAHGNQFIKKMARILDGSIRDIDLVGRASEAEFFVILPATPARESLVVAERIECRLKEELGSGHDAPLATSIGIASFPEYGTSPDLIDAARSALSQAVAAGGSKIRFAANSTSHAMGSKGQPGPAAGSRVSSV
jgi:diguanylate cyclase (GGDEF)-like protein